MSLQRSLRYFFIPRFLPPISEEAGEAAGSSCAHEASVVVEMDIDLGGAEAVFEDFLGVKVEVVEVEFAQFLFPRRDRQPGIHERAQQHPRRDRSQRFSWQRR
jgi:hypothetical protein